MSYMIRCIKIGFALHLLLFSFDSWAQDAGICDRTGIIEYRILSELKRLGIDVKCDEVTASELEKVTEINTYPKIINSLGSGDFAGLTNLVYLRIDGLKGTVFPEDVFHELTRLGELLILFNDAGGLHANQFQGLVNLKKLTILNNSLTGLPENLFQGLPKLERLELEGSSVESLHENLFSGLTELT